MTQPLLDTTAIAQNPCSTAWARQIPKKDILSSTDLSAEQSRTVLDYAKFLKQQRMIHPQPIVPVEGRAMAMIFEKQSLRTRVSFETAFHELGGNSVYLTQSDIDMGNRESISDVARVLSKWCSIIVARLCKHEAIVSLAANSQVTVVNALTDVEHPCQALADLQTIEECWGTEPQKLVYIGDGNNVANSFAVTASQLGHQVVICGPPGYEASAHVYDSPRVTHVYDPVEALEGATAVYTDVWVSMGQEDEEEVRIRRFEKYQVDQKMMELAAPGAIFLHCLPARRGLEVSPEVIDGPSSKVFQQSENRLYAQKALMHLLLEGALS